MPKTSLRSHLLRLAVQDAKLRPALVRVLEASGGLTGREQAILRKASQGNTSVVQQPPIVIQQPPVIVQQDAPAPAPAPVGVPMFMPPMAAPVMAPAQPPAAPWQMPPTPTMQSPNQTTDQTPGVAEAPPPVGAMFVTERTQRGFEHDLLPEMERMVASGATREQAGQEILGMIATAFRDKGLLYNILIRHQSTFESDAVYRESLERLVQAWVADTANDGG